MLIPIVIPLHPTGSKWGNNELRYTLRSFEKYLANAGQLYLIGNGVTPDWIQKQIYLPTEDLPGGRNKEYNIYRKLLRACEVIGQPFLYANDDHFLLAPHDAGNFPNYYEGTLADLLQRVERGNPYRITVKNTINELEADDIYNVDVHCPITVEPNNFNIMASDSLFGKVLTKHYTGLVKTLFCGAHYGDWVQQTDLKHKDPDTLPNLTGRPWFSVGDKGLSNNFKNMLEELYPVKSRWEK